MSLDRFKRAQALRRDGTGAEAKLWSRLRNRQLGGCKFVRQEPVGPYIADFVCRERRLVIEVDGGQHADSARDRRRDATLGAEGYRTIRVWNNEVMENIEGVLEVILSALRES